MSHCLVFVFWVFADFIGKKKYKLYFELLKRFANMKMELCCRIGPVIMLTLGGNLKKHSSLVCVHILQVALLEPAKKYGFVYARLKSGVRGLTHN